MRALVIGNNATLALSVVSALGAAGLEADVLSDWFVPRLRFSRYCRNYVRVPFRSLDLENLSGSGLTLIKDYCQTHDIDLVIPADLPAAIGLSRLPQNELPHFPVASTHTLALLHDKWEFHQLLQREQLPSPETQLLWVDAPDALTLPFPIILKPAAGEGGEGIHICESQAELLQLCASAAVRGERYIAQRLIIGHDVDISILAEHGRVVAHTIQHTETDDTKRFVRDDSMLEVAQGIVRASGYHGLAHFDMRIDSQDGALYAIECNPRVWGSLMYSVWAGVNFIELGCEIALGRRPRDSIPPAERVWHQGVAPRRMLQALLQGRLAPKGMTGATLASWEQAHRDPWTQVIGKLTERGENYWRSKRQR
jgi:predicted ATP-grasp superfamily ATP-dependent carboligase